MAQAREHPALSPASAPAGARPLGRLLAALYATALLVGGALLVLLGALAFAHSALGGDTPASLGAFSAGLGVACLLAALPLARRAAR